MFVGFHLVLEVFTSKLVDDMFQKVKVQKIPVFAKLCPEITESCILMNVHEMIINKLLMLMFSRNIQCYQPTMKLIHIDAIIYQCYMCAIHQIKEPTFQLLDVLLH